MDGYLRIKTKIDNKGIDKDISELEDKIKKLQTDNANSSTDERMLQEEIANYEKLQQEAEKYRRKLEEINNDKKKYEDSLSMLNSSGQFPNKQIVNKNGATEIVDTSTGLNAYKTKQVISEIENEIQQMQQKYSQATNEIDKQAPKIEKVRGKLEKVKAKQTENNNKIEQFKQKIDKINLKKVENSIDSVGRNIQNSIGKIGKMAMAVMGLRTAWGAVRSAIGMVSQYNSQVSTDFEYMRYCMANAIAPAVQYLVQLLYTVLSYVNAIASAWFGINLFSNSSAKNFKKMQNSAGGTAKSAKEIQKSLQGFDEMNILQGDGSTSGNTGVGIPTPSMDLSGIQGEVPAWLKWIIDNKDLILAVLAGIVGGVLALKLGLGGLISLGIGVAIAGIVYAVQSLLEYLQNPTFTNLGKFIQSIGVAIMGVGIVIAIAVGSLIGVIIGAIVLIWGTIVKYWDNIKAFFQSGIDWLTGKSDWVHQMFGDTIGNIYDAIVDSLQRILNWFDTIFKGIKANFDEIISFIKNIFSGNWEGAWQNVKNIFGNIWNGIKELASAAWQNICNIFGNVAGWFREKFTGAWEAVKNVFSTGGKIFDGIKEGILNGLKTIVNAIISGINKVIAIPFNGLNSALRKIKSVDILGVRPFNFINTIGVPQIPRLAKGAVLTRPTPVIAGEAGAEAFIPLENNTEGLELIAEKIASKIGLSGGSFIINMDGRTIQRGIARRQNELAFARNGR